MTLYFSNAGPMITYKTGTLIIEDLNPQNEIKFRMYRKELVKFSLKCLWAAIKGAK